MAGRYSLALYLGVVGGCLGISVDRELLAKDKSVTVSPAEKSKPEKVSLDLALIKRRHAEFLASVSTINLRVDVKAKRLDDPSLSRQWTPLAKWHWMVAGGRERTKFHRLALRLKDEATSADYFHDEVRDPHIVKYLQGWNPAAPVKLTPMQQHGVRGGIVQRPFAVSLRDMRPNLLLAVRIPEGSEIATLPDLMDRYGVDSVTQVHLGAETCPQLTIKPDENIVLQFALSPSHAWACRRFQLNDVSRCASKDTDPDSCGGFVQRRVVEWSQNLQAVWLPKITESHICRDPQFQNIVSIILCEVVKEQINQPLPKDAFVLRFPKYLQVVHDPLVDGERRVQLWGDDNKPLVEIKSLKDLERQEHIAAGDSLSLDGGAKQDQSSTGVIMIVVNVVVIASLLILVFWFRRKRRMRP